MKFTRLFLSDLTLSMSQETVICYGFLTPLQSRVLSTEFSQALHRQRMIGEGFGAVMQECLLIRWLEEFSHDGCLITASQMFPPP